MRFPPSFLDQIRARVNISSVVGRRVQWDRRKTQAAKGDYWACCPFHAEKSPSFHADDRKGRYHCFGCKASGDIFTFLVEKDGVPFPEAVERLASEAGLPMPEITEADVKREEQRASLYDIMEMAQQLFVAELQSARAARARGYLSDRDLQPSIQKEFGIGFAPDDKGWLRGALAAKGISLEAMIEAGLVVAGRDIPVAYDRFRDRIMFPIRDSRGRVIAFGGRALSKDVAAKYLNSPETPIFHKGEILYNFDKARSAAHQNSRLVAVEGYVDVIAMHRAGLPEAVAPLGTALTTDQMALMWKAVPEPVLCFDGDAAGLKAAFRALDLALPLLKPGYSLRFAFMPEGLDPDDLLRNQGRDAVKAVVEAAEPLAEVLWRRGLSENDRSTPERRALFERDMRSQVATIVDETVKRHYVDDIRERLAVLFGRVEQAGRSLQRRVRSQPFLKRGQQFWEVQQPASRQLRSAAAQLDPHAGLKRVASEHDRKHTDRRERLVVLSMINHPELLAQFWEEFAAFEPSSKDHLTLIATVLEWTSGATQLDGNALKLHLETQGMGDVIVQLEAQARRLDEWFSLPGAASEDTAAVLKQIFALKRKAVTLGRELISAEQAFAEEPTDTNFDLLVDIRNQLSSLAGSEASIPGFGTASGRMAEDQ
jgi:DNA primase